VISFEGALIKPYTCVSIVAIAIMVVGEVAIELVIMVVAVVMVAITTPLGRDPGYVLTHTGLTLRSGVLSFPPASVF
jgi:hypothetical protein